MHGTSLRPLRYTPRVHWYWTKPLKSHPDPPAPPGQSNQRSSQGLLRAHAWLDYSLVNSMPSNSHRLSALCYLHVYLSYHEVWSHRYTHQDARYRLQLRRHQSPPIKRERKEERRAFDMYALSRVRFSATVTGSRAHINPRVSNSPWHPSQFNLIFCRHLPLQ